MLSLLPLAAVACTNYVVSPGASADGSTQMSYSSDGASLYGYMRSFPAASHAPGAVRDIVGFESGQFTGRIPEARAQR